MMDWGIRRKFKRLNIAVVSYFFLLSFGPAGNFDVWCKGQDERL